MQSNIRSRDIERKAMKTQRKKQKKERGDEDTVKQTEKERGDPCTQRKKRSSLCF